jgi:hypothetical protein
MHVLGVYIAWYLNWCKSTAAKISIVGGVTIPIAAFVVMLALNVLFNSIWVFLFTQLLTVPVVIFVAFVCWRHANQVNEKRQDFKKIQNFQRQIQGKRPHWWRW